MIGDQYVTQLAVDSAARSQYNSERAALALMVKHLHEEHKMTIRQINLRLGLTDKQVKRIIES